MSKYGEQIFKLVQESSGHMTAEQLFLELKKIEPKVVQATVYNNLNVLCQKGLIRKMSIEGSPDRYDKIQKHDHLVCQNCGALSDINFEDLTRNLEDQLGEGILFYDLKVFYLCQKCRQSGIKSSAGDSEQMPLPGRQSINSQNQTQRNSESTYN